MLKTQGISYPRSGHGALYHVLRRYFRGELVYCDPEVPRGHTDSSGSLCGCGQVPCENPQNNYAKSHDFGLLRGGQGLPVRPEVRYLVQYRSPVRAIVSNFGLHLRANPDDDNVDAWRAYAIEHMNYWVAFIDKWVLTRPAGTWCDIPYVKLIGDAPNTVRKAIEFVAGGTADPARLDDALQFVKLEARDRFASFQYPDEGFYKELEAMAGDRLRRLDLPAYVIGV